ncbi:MAG: electron transport complex subunit RsxG [Methylophilaceae bacterium]
MSETILKHTSKTALTLIAFAFAFTLLLTYVFAVTKVPIEKSEAAARMALFRQIVPEHMHNNDMLNDAISIEPNDLLGNQQATIANRARFDSVPTVVILEAIAHDGYSGDIKLLIAIKYDGSIAGVRVLTHKETPGLGDYIDIAKGNWIKLFDDKSLQKTNEAKWKVKKDGGEFDYMAGATITPRAVVKAVHKTLQYFALNKEALFS